MQKKHLNTKNNNIISNMTNKRGILLIALLVFLIAMCSSVLAENNPTILTLKPSSNANINGSYNFTVAVGNVTTSTNWNITNCSWYNTTSGGSTWTIFGSFANSSGNESSFSNMTATASMFSDGTYTINVTCFSNLAGTFNADTQSLANTGIEIDNTAPTCSMDLLTTIVERGNPFTTDAGASTDAVDSALTYDYTITYPNRNTYTLTRINTTDATEFFDGKELPFQGMYQIDLTVTDNVGKSTACTQQEFRVVDDDDDEIIITQTVKEQEKKSSNLVIIIGAIIFVILALFVVILITHNIKTKK